MAASARSNISRAQSCASQTSLPMPAYCAPCPGNRNAVFAIKNPLYFVIRQSGRTPFCRPLLWGPFAPFTSVGAVEGHYANKITVRKHFLLFLNQKLTTSPKVELPFDVGNPNKFPMIVVKRVGIYNSCRSFASFAAHFSAISFLNACSFSAMAVSVTPSISAAKIAAF